MSRLVRFDRCPTGRRCYLAGRWRLHHGLLGLLMVGLGAALAAHDWADWPWHLTDREDIVRAE